MESDLRLLGFIAGLRAFGFLMLQAFLALYLHNVLNLGYAEVGALVLAFGLPPIILSPIAGLMADRFGRRRLLLLSISGEALGVLFLSYSMLLGSLLLVSVGSMLSFLFDSLGGPANSAYVADLAEGSERTKGFTWIRIGYNAGAGAGVAIGGILVGVIGFPAVAALGALFIGASSIVVGIRLRPSPYDLRLRALHRGGVAADAANDAVGSTVSVAPTGRSSIGTSLRVLVADRIFLEMCLAFAFASLVAGQWGVTFQLFANGALGLPYDVIGLGISLNCFIVVFGQTATTRSVLGRRHTRVGVLGVLLYVVAFLGLGASGEWMIAPLAVFTLAVIVSTAGENFLAVPQTTLPSNLAPERELGNYNGAFQTINNAAFLLSVFFGGVVLAAIPDPLLAWVVLVSPAVPCLLLLQHVGRRIPETANRA